MRCASGCGCSEDMRGEYEAEKLEQTRQRISDFARSARWGRRSVPHRLLIDVNSASGAGGAGVRVSAAPPWALRSGLP